MKLRIVSKYSMLKCICWLPGAAQNSGQVQTQIKFKISHVMIRAGRTRKVSSLLNRENNLIKKWLFWPHREVRPLSGIVGVQFSNVKPNCKNNVTTPNIQTNTNTAHMAPYIMVYISPVAVQV